MAQLSDLRNALESDLEAISGLRAYPDVRGSIAVPAAVIRPGLKGAPVIDYDQQYDRCSALYFFTILVMVNATITRAAFDNLDTYTDDKGANSIKSAVEDGANLAAVDGFNWAHIKQLTDYGPIEYDKITYLGAIFTAEVSASVS